jgi:hypothetical protein
MDIRTATIPTDDMKKAALITLIFLALNSCGDGITFDESPQDARRLENAVWRQEGKKGNYLHHFAGGVLTSEVVDFGVVPNRKEYAYRIEQDTVYLKSLVGGVHEKWAVWIFSDNDAQITAWAGQADPFIFRVKKY